MDLCLHFASGAGAINSIAVAKRDHSRAAADFGASLPGAACLVSGPHCGWSAMAKGRRESASVY